MKTFLLLGLTCLVAWVVLYVVWIACEVRNPCKTGHYECCRTYLVGKVIFTNQRYFVCDERVSK